MSKQTFTRDTSTTTRTPDLTSPTIEQPTKDFGSNSAGSGKQVHVDPEHMRPGELPWLEQLNPTMFA